MRPLVPISLVPMAVCTFVRKNFGSLRRPPRLRTARVPLIGAGVGAVIGFYDGFFVTGHGQLLDLHVYRCVRLRVPGVIGKLEVVDTATNLSYRGLLRPDWPRLLLPGGADGRVQHPRLPRRHRLAILRGNRFVQEWFFLAVVAADHAAGSAATPCPTIDPTKAIPRPRRSGNGRCRRS